MLRRTKRAWKILLCLKTIPESHSPCQIKQQRSFRIKDESPLIPPSAGLYSSPWLDRFFKYLFLS